MNLEEAIKRIVTEVKKARYEIHATPAKQRNAVVEKHVTNLWSTYKIYVAGLPLEDERRDHLCDLIGISRAALREAAQEA